MDLEKQLIERSGNCCELCGSTSALQIYQVPPVSTGGIDGSLWACATCIEQIDNPEKTDANHWRCLNESMWSEHDVVKVVAWRMLNRLKTEGWPQELLEMIYLDDAALEWAKATGEGEDESDKVVHRDVNGVVLTAGDSVVLIKDLKVKGTSMTAKQGTAVRRISLDLDNPEYIEGKVDGQNIVILTKFVKKL